MATTIQSQLVCDSSTYANFSQWASAISAAFASFTWTQSTDTGQVMWSGMTISAVSMSGTNATYTYASLTGLALAVGRALTITGMTNSANNGVKVITALGSGTFTVVNASGVTESGSSGVVTAQSTVPGSNAFVYEVWTPNDGLTNFYVKVEYGNTGTAAVPGLRLTLSTTTNGAGTATGFIIGPQLTQASGFTVPSTTTQYECSFSGAAGRIGVMLWRNGTNSCQQLFAIERSLNGSGVYTSTHATLWTTGNSSAAGYQSHYSQRSLHFTAGAGPASLSNTTGGIGGWVVRVYAQNSNNSNTGPFNGAVSFDTPAPMIGYFDYPCTVLGVGPATDFVEGVPFQTTLYGSTRTYLPGKTSSFGYNPVGANGTTNTAVALRFD